MSCELPETVWDLAALVSLVLAYVDVPVNLSQYLGVLVSLLSETNILLSETNIFD